MLRSMTFTLTPTTVSRSFAAISRGHPHRSEAQSTALGRRANLRSAHSSAIFGGNQDPLSSMMAVHFCTITLFQDPRSNQPFIFTGHEARWLMTKSEFSMENPDKLKRHA